MSESLQWALLAPLTVLATLGIVQGAVIVHARTAVGEAASAAVEALAIAGDRAQADAVARRIARAADLRDVEVRISDAGELLSVEVAGRAQTFLDVGQGAVSGRASQPRERPR